MNRFLKLLSVFSLMLSCLLFTGCNSNTLDMSKYVSVEFSGVNGNGTAKVRLDEDSFLTDANKIDNSFDGMALLGLELVGFGKINADKTEGLSNGDTVNVSLVWNNTALEKFKFKMGGPESKNFTVEGLVEPEYFDAFDSGKFNVDTNTKGVHVLYEGISPIAKVSISNDCGSDEILSKVKYSTDAEYVANGDTIKITAEYAPENDSDPHILENDSTEITVEGVSEYLASLDKVSSDSWSKITEVMSKSGNNWLASSGVESGFKHGTYTYYMNNAQSVSDITWDNAYLLAIDSGINYADHVNDRFINRLVYTYHFSVAGAPNMTSKAFATKFDNIEPGYFYMYIDNVVINEDGTINVTADDVKLEKTCFDSEEDAINDCQSGYMDVRSLTSQAIE